MARMPMTDQTFGRWQCSNPTCDNAVRLGIEAPRLYQNTDTNLLLEPEPTQIRCGICGVVTQVQQLPS